MHRVIAQKKPYEYVVSRIRKVLITNDQLTRYYLSKIIFFVSEKSFVSNL